MKFGTSYIARYISSLMRRWQQRSFRAQVEQERRKTNLFEHRQKQNVWQYARLVLSQKKRFGNIISSVQTHASGMKVAFSSMGAFLVLGTVYVVAFSPYFQIAPSKVIIERTDAHTDINLAYRSIDNVYGTSIFFVNTAEIKNTIISWQKSVQNVSISRLYPNGLKIVLNSYAPKFFTEMTVDEKKKNYLISQNGVLIEDRSVDKNLARLDIVDATLEEGVLLNYREVVPLATMEKIIALQEGFAKKFSGATIAKMAYFSAEQELHMSLDNGTTILFDLQSLIQNQLSLIKLYTEAHPEVLQKDVFTYLDVRNQGKIFLCRERTVCKKNLIRIYGKYYF